MARPGQVERFGQSLELSELPVTSPFAQSFLSAAGRGWDIAWEDTKTRWGALSEGDPGVSRQDFIDRFGEDLAGAWNTGVRESNADFLAWEAGVQQQAEQFESRPFSELLGGILPSLPDPVNVATLRFGGGIVRSGAQKTIGAFLKENVIGGFKAGAASLPPELVMQQRVYGDVRPEQLLLSAIAPVVISPALGAPAFVANRIRNGRAQRMADENVAPIPGDDMEQVAKVLEDNPDVPLAPPRPLEQEPPPPPVKQFDEFEGGLDAWVRAAAAGDAAAIEFATSRGFDMDSPAFAAFLTGETNRLTALSDIADDAGAAADVTLALGAFVRGDTSTEVQATLRQHGVVDGEGRIAPAFRELAEQLSGDRAGGALRKFMNQGPRRARLAHQQKLWDEGRRVLDDETIDPATKRAEVLRISEELEEASAGPARLDGDIDRAALLATLDVMRLNGTQSREAVGGQAGETPAPQGDVLDKAGAGAEHDRLTADARAKAEQAGADVSAVDRVVDGVIEAMTRCRA